MTGVVLFCIAEEAKPFVHKVMDAKLDIQFKQFYLVETQKCPSTREGFKRELKEDESFQSEFIGASEQDCQKWLLDRQYDHLFLDQDLIAIADAHGAETGTIMLQTFHREGIEFGRHGVLPRERDTWHSFRIDPKKFADMKGQLQEGAWEVAYPVYFAHKEDLTDERGVFDVDKAHNLDDPDIQEWTKW